MAGCALMLGDVLATPRIGGERAHCAETKGYYKDSAKHAHTYPHLD
jgi:hypothetical protein